MSNVLTALSSLEGTTVGEHVGEEAPLGANNQNKIKAVTVTSKSLSFDSATKEATTEVKDGFFEALWSNTLKSLEEKLDAKIYSAWIKPVVLSLDGCSFGESVGDKNRAKITLELLTPNKFCCDHVERHYLSQIKEVLGTFSPDTDFSFSLKVSPAEALGASRAQTKPRVARLGDYSSTASTTPTSSGAPYRESPIASDDKSNLNPKYNFSNFVVGACNQFAHAVCLRVSEELGTTYNPLFIYGGVGLGKTHLANAVGNASRRRSKKVLLVSSEQFVSELISSLRSSKMPQFKEKFRSLDLLIIDDVQFLIGKERTQEEFFHTFNELHQRHKQIIITSDKLPQELIGLEERLRTRFASGLSVDLQAPDFETRVAILTRKAEQAGVTILEEAAKTIAIRIDSNVRELEGALNKLLALSSLNNSRIDMPLVDEVLRSIAPKREVEVSAESIQKIVSSKFNVSINDLVGKRRTQNVAYARQVAMYLCRSLTGHSYPEIGALFGGRDHSTVIHAKRVIEERIETDADFKQELDTLQKQITGTKA